MSSQDDVSRETKIAELLLLVARGEQEKAESLIREDTSLLLEHGDVTEYSGRSFANITAFQYAVWALDKYMCQMMLDCVAGDEKIRMALRQQYEELERDGLRYELDGVTHHHKRHFDFSPIMSTLQTYLDQFESWDWPERESYWCHQVGLMQRYVPAHVAQEYCNKKRSPDFNSPTFERSLSFYNYVKGKADTWWCGDDETGLKMGVDFAVAGGQVGGWGGGGVKRGDWRGNGVGGSAAIDLAMLTRLCEVRTADIKKIYESLVPKAERVVEETSDVSVKGMLRRLLKDWLIKKLD